MFGIEISRLARSNAEVARLMEFAAISETLPIDADGVYDPGDVNDRMLLGMKSTIGEVELHVMAQRLQASKRAAAERGELRTSLPVGYFHDEAGEIVINPDAEVQAGMRDLFAAFTARGSAYGVVAAFTDRRFPLRAYGAPEPGNYVGGHTDSRPGARGGAQPVLRRGVRAGAVLLASLGRSRRHRAYRAGRAVPLRAGGADPRSPCGLHRLAGLSGQRGHPGGQPDQLRGPTAA